MIAHKFTLWKSIDSMLKDKSNKKMTAILFTSYYVFGILSLLCILNMNNMVIDRVSFRNDEDDL